MRFFHQSEMIFAFRYILYYHSQINFDNKRRFQSQFNLFGGRIIVEVIILHEISQESLHVCLNCLSIETILDPVWSRILQHFRLRLFKVVFTESSFVQNAELRLNHRPDHVISRLPGYKVLDADWNRNDKDEDTEEIKQSTYLSLSDQSCVPCPPPG